MSPEASFNEEGFGYRDSRAFTLLMGPGLPALMGLLLLASFFVFYQFILHERKTQAWSDEVARAQIHASVFHFSLEEKLRGGPEPLEDPWQALEGASRCVASLLSGGRHGHGPVKPLEDPALLEEARGMERLLADVRRMGHALEEAAPERGLTQDLDNAFDQTVNRFLVAATDLQMKLAEVLRHSHFHLQTALLGLLSGWFLVLALAVYGVHVFQRRRKKAEAAVLGAKRDWEHTFDSVPDLIAILDRDHNIKRVNRAMAERLGIAESEAIDRKCYELVHGSPDPHENCPHNCLLEDGQAHRSELYEERLGGYFSISVSPLVDASGTVRGAIHVAHEITDRKRAEERLKGAYDELEQTVAVRTTELRETNRWLQANLEELRRTEHELRESQNRYRSLSQEFNALLDAIDDAILLLAPNLKVIWANRWAVAHFADGGEDLRGLSCHAVVHGTEEICEGCPARACFETGSGVAVRREHADGRLFDIRTFPIPGADGRTENVIVVASDVTEKISIEQEAFRTAHLASLGELAAGVAHEINNPVNGIINYAQLLSNRSETDSDTKDLSARIIKEGDRVATIVGNLLSFSRDRREPAQPASVREILSDSLELVGSQLERAGIRLEIDLPDDLPLVRVTPQRIQQVFLNLISNGRYALNDRFPTMDKNKRLEIHATCQGQGDASVVRIVFRDHGTGIPEDNLNRVLNPFVTTKPLGQGTGLGLSISHNIIKEHGGRLTLASREGEYTAVTVELPAVPPEPPTDPPPREHPTER